MISARIFVRPGAEPKERGRRMTECLSSSRRHRLKTEDSKTENSLDADLQLALEGDGLLVVRVDLDGALHVGGRLRAVAALKEDAAEQDMRVDELVLHVPEDRSLELADGRGQLAAAHVDAAREQVRLGVHRLDAEGVAQLHQR